jgi:hypothetical protein
LRHRVDHCGDRSFRQQRTPQVGVQHRAGQIEYGTQGRLFAGLQQMGATRYCLFFAQQFFRCTVTPVCARLIQHRAHCFDCSGMTETSYHRLHRSQVENAIH